ncbi:TetR/AcrR family transcriptional regulator [Streptomyces kanamyceticus]|uniref:TetR/AcrR family transcriptional regulator n=1 Tax=Streptomyces kanamyceticus TaxID=1967 RepID=A0A5J6G3X2_STRKN|nr:TetR/AcrR family transcriptional regulator [Streptomyces kanamyceticus]QEU90329.1 TetR/AcrR family transcriptional regulator [Streptomyces kanamyceticus]
MSAKSDGAERTARALPTGARAERKREAIVAAARTLFLRDGFGVGMDAIAAEAGVSKVTVYNHFGSKEALFTAVIAGALDEPLAASSSAAALEGLTRADDLREAFLAAARAWVDAVRTDQDMNALRQLVAREIHRFPSLGKAWEHHGPESHHPAVAGALRELAEQGRLAVPDTEAAVIQLYSLLVFPHLVFGSYGTDVSDDLTERLIVAGVDMFLGYYAV